MEQRFPTISAASVVAGLEVLEDLATNHGMVQDVGSIDSAKVATTAEYIEGAFEIEVALYTTRFID